MNYHTFLIFFTIEYGNNEMLIFSVRKLNLQSFYRKVIKNSKSVSTNQVQYNTTKQNKKMALQVANHDCNTFKQYHQIYIGSIMTY